MTFQHVMTLPANRFSTLLALRVSGHLDAVGPYSGALLQAPAPELSGQKPGLARCDRRDPGSTAVQRSPAVTVARQMIAEP